MFSGGIINPGSACYIISALRCLWSHFFNIKNEKQYKKLNDKRKIDEFYNFCEQTINNKHEISFFLSKLKSCDGGLFGDFDVYRSDDSRMFYRSLIKFIVKLAPGLSDLYYFKCTISCFCFNLPCKDLEIENILVQGYDDMFGVIPIILGKQLQCKQCKDRYNLRNVPRYFMVYCDKQNALVNRNMEIRLQRLNSYDISCSTRKCISLSISTGGTGHSYAYVQDNGIWSKYDDGRVTNGITGNIQDNVMFFILSITGDETKHWSNFDEYSMFDDYNKKLHERRRLDDDRKKRTQDTLPAPINGDNMVNNKDKETINKYITCLHTIVNDTIDSQDKIIKEQANKIQERDATIEKLEAIIHDKSTAIDELGIKLKEQDNKYSVLDPYLTHINIVTYIIDNLPETEKTNFTKYLEDLSGNITLRKSN